MEYCLEKASRDIIHFVFRVHHCFSTDFPLQNVIFILIIILYNLYFFLFYCNYIHHFQETSNESTYEIYDLCCYAHNCGRPWSNCM